MTLERGGSPRYPGVEVRNNGSQHIPLQTVTTVLPADAGMRFGVPGNPGHQLTVMDDRGRTTAYMGTISDDGQSLSFSDVDLGVPDAGAGSQSVMWVCVSADDDAPTGTTSLEFAVGDRVSTSTTVTII